MRIDGQHGFTLLEVVVAFAIAAVALAALFDGVGFGVAAVDQSTRYEEALSRARSHLAAVGPEIDQLEGVHSGDDGGGYHWQLDVQPIVQSTQIPATANALPTLYAVHITISWGRHEGRGVTLATERIGRPKH
jgi:general secretion pathway protein I